MPRATVDWPTLSDFTERPRLPTSDICVPGYMVAFDEIPDKNGRLNRFLLVPDPGNWLHPPHLDPGDVILVRMTGGMKIRLLERKMVWVIGRLSLSPVDWAGFHTAYTMQSSRVRETTDDTEPRL